MGLNYSAAQPSQAEAPATQTSQSTKKEWSCDICKVTATCPQNLIMHLEGKKHKSKVEAIKGEQTLAKTCATVAKLKPNPTVISKTNAETEIVPKVVNIQVNGPMTNLWCQSCELKCSSTIEMVSHLQEKNHIAKMMELEKYESTYEVVTPSCGMNVVQKDLANGDGQYHGLLGEVNFMPDYLFAGRVDGRLGFMPPFSPMSPLRREIEKERLPGELLREMQERQILKEEVRVDIERMMSMRNAQIDFLLDHSAVKPHTSEFMSREGYWPSQGRAAAVAPFAAVQTPSKLPKVGVDKKATVSYPHKVKQVKGEISETEKKAEAPPKETSHLTKKDWICDVCQITTTSEQELKCHRYGKRHKAYVEEALKRNKAVAKISGSNAKPSQKDKIRGTNASPIFKIKQVKGEILETKKKADVPTKETSQLPKKDWSCDLCQITTTSEQELKNHRSGRKHIANVEALMSNGTVAKASGSNAKPVVSKEKVKPKSGVETINIQAAGKMHQVLKDKTGLWCPICKAKCNSTFDMVSHLRGKKHNAEMMELKNRQNDI